MKSLDAHPHVEDLNGTATLESVQAKFENWRASTQPRNPPRVPDAYRALSPEGRNALFGLRREITILGIALSDIASGRPLDTEDRKRAQLAADRVTQVAQIIYGRRK